MIDNKFVRTIDGNINVDKENGHELRSILEVGDLVTIELFSLKKNKKVTRLFQIDFITPDKSYISFVSPYGNLSFENGDWNKFDKELNPVIQSVLTVEKLESIEFELPKSKSKSNSR